MEYTQKTNKVWAYSSNIGNAWWMYGNDHCYALDKIYRDFMARNTIKNAIAVNYIKYNIEQYQLPDSTTFDNVDYASDIANNIANLNYNINVQGKSYYIDMFSMQQIECRTKHRRKIFHCEFEKLPSIADLKKRKIIGITGIKF